MSDPSSLRSEMAEATRAMLEGILLLAFGAGVVFLAAFL